MTTIKKIVCAVDLTKASGPAFDRALSLARASKGKLYVLHAVSTAQRFAARAAERLSLLTTLKDRADRAGIPVRIVVQQGDAAGLIVLHANSRKADLVVIGSNRRRGWRRFREGSVGERVLRRAAWPLLIVPTDLQPGTRTR